MSVSRPRIAKSCTVRARLRRSLRPLLWHWSICIASISVANATGQPPGHSPILPTADMPAGNQDLMAQLVDIQEPTSNWFIPAIGWWLIAALLLLLALLLFAHWRRYQARQRQQQFWRVAQQQLNTLDLALPHAATHISQILKQAMITAAPHHNALRLSGRDWQSYLQQSFADVAAMPCPDLTTLAYAASTDSTALGHYHALAMCWLKAAQQHGLPDYYPPQDKRAAQPSPQESPHA